VSIVFPVFSLSLINVKFVKHCLNNKVVKWNFNSLYKKTGFKSIADINLDSFTCHV
jgi:hypothetical protein